MKVSSDLNEVMPNYNSYQLGYMVKFEPDIPVIVPTLLDFKLWYTHLHHVQLQRIQSENHLYSRRLSAWIQNWLEWGSKTRFEI